MVPFNYIILMTNSSTARNVITLSIDEITFRIIIKDIIILCEQYSFSNDRGSIMLQSLFLV